MKKNVLALSVAALVAGFAGGAHAITTVGGADAATTLEISNTGVGHMLVVPYFTTQDGNSTLLSIVNTNESVGKAVKVRFRGAANSDDIYDFQVFLSPGDVWTANVSSNADGLSYLTTNDASCTKPAKATLNSTPFLTTRLNPKATAEARAAGTREGYVEIFNMGDIPAGSDLYTAIKHVGGVAPCGTGAVAAVTAAWAALDSNKADVAAYAAAGITPPSTGLAANWTIINVPKAVSWSGAATAIEAVTAANTPALGNVVYFPQTLRNPALPVVDGGTGNAVGTYTADPLLAAGTVAAGFYDLPDMSTPYVATAVNPGAQAATLTAAIAATSVINEYVTDPGIFAATDWVFSMPTRRYYTAVNYAATPIAGVIPGAGANDYFTADNVSLNGDQLCIRNVTVSPWDREERSPVAAEEVVISPGTPGAPVLFCGEASVLSFNNGSTTKSGVLSASVALKDIDVPYQDGWARLLTPGATAAAGLPILGQSFVSAFNPAVAAGVAGNFGMGWAHRFARP